MSIWIKIMSFITGLEKLVELASTFWKRRKRTKEIEDVKKEDEHIKEVVKDGTVDDLNKEFGWTKDK